MRVLVVGERSLFEEGIEELIRQEPGLEIVGRLADPQDTARLFKEHSPDVILVADDEAATRLAPDLMGMVREGFCMRMIEVHLATNTLCVYRGDQQPIREAGDLVGIMRHVCGGLTPDAQVPLAPVAGEPVA
jgi:DNA-binding NarL/FixJ family response regulator